MEKNLLAIPDLCTGCNRCTYICSAVKEGEFKPSMARLHVNNFALNGYTVQSVCFHCPKPDCLKACPEEIISKNEETGAVLVDRNKCTGCGECVRACPYGMIDLDEDQLAYKCDLCDGDPSCVKECEFGAILFQEADKDLRKLRGKQMKQRIESDDPEEKRYQLGKNIMTAARE